MAHTSNPTHSTPHSNPPDKHYQHALSALLTIREAASYLAVSPASLRTPAFRRRLGLRVVKISRAVRFRREDLERLISKGVQPLPGDGVQR